MKKKTMKIINGSTEGAVTGICENYKAYNIVEDDLTDSAEITMYGEVVKDRPRSFWSEKEDKRLYIVLGEFLEDLEKVKKRSKVTVRINSPGGDLYAGIAIKNRLQELEGEVETIVDSLAASAASIILQGGKKRKVYSGSQVMVHGASGFLFGYYNMAALKEAQKQLEAANQSALETYAQRTGIDKAKIKADMEKTEWMTGQAIVDKGYADEVIDGNVSMSLNADGTYMMVNGIMMPTSGFECLPDGIQRVNDMVIPGSEPDVTDKKTEKGGEKKVTAEEMRENYPEVVAEIEKGAIAAQGNESTDAVKDAIEKERQRMREIDEIAGMVADKKMLQEAKFTNPVSAAELALMAMRKQAELGKQFMSDSNDDVNESGVRDVASVPSGDMSMEMEQNDIAAGAALIAGVENEGGK